MLKNKPRIILYYLVITLVFVISSSGCHSDPWYAYKKTLQSGQKVIPWVRSVDSLVDSKNVDHFITHYGFDRSSPREWQTTIYFYGRYTMQIVQDVSIDYWNNTITGTVGEMNIVINEVTEIDSTLGASYGMQIRCGKDEWDKFVKSGGDFTVFPMKIVKDKPHPNFEAYRESWGKDILKP